METNRAGALPGRRETRKAETRRELILAGRRLFGERGLYESRIEDLTTRAGIAKGTLYTYFADKDELIRAVASTGFDELEHFVALRVSEGEGEADTLRRAIRAHLQFFAANPDLMRVFHQLRGMLTFNRPSWRPLRVALNDYLTALARILSGTPRVAAMRAADRVDLASLIFGTVSGITSVVAASGEGGAPTRRPALLVEGMVAMATVFIAAREQ